VEQAKVKGMELDLAHQFDPDGKALSCDQMSKNVHELEMVRTKLTELCLAAYVRSQQILTPEQRARVKVVEY
jgi:hypothetical protein